MKTSQLLVGLITAMAPATAFAQAQVVQLPTFHQFSVSTTVSAPDRGGILAGGVRSSRQGRVSRGMPFASKIPGLSRLGKNVAIGREDDASTISVHASIIDFKELEGALLAKVPGGRSLFETTLWEAETEASRLSSHVEPAVRMANRKERAAVPAVAFTRSTPPSVAELKSRGDLAKRAKSDEALQFFQRAVKAEREGKKAVAKIFYQMAGRRGDPKLQVAVMKKLKALEPQRQANQPGS